MLQTWWRRVARVLVSRRVYLSTIRPRTTLLLGVLCVAPSCNALGDLNFFTEEDDRQLGEEAYPQILAGEQVVQSGPAHEMVNRIMNRLVSAAREEHASIVDKFAWQVELIDNDSTVNAFALPGGKMAVYTGILPVAETEAGLAVVMGHEIAHVIERHGTEAMTRQYGVDVLIDIILEGDAAQLSRIAASLYHLRYGRDAELEADALGLRFMARAGYDPRVAVQFWSRMASLAGSSPPEFLSTHPTHARRIDQIRDELPQVLPIYEANKAPTP
jgi:predicted Zn-dependent protease